MTQAPATPELVERLRDLTRFMTGTPRSRAMLDAAAVLEAQQARIAELEAELADAAIPSPYCEICGSCGSEGCGCEHKCKYAHSHPDVVRDMDALQALADRFEKALTVIANASERSETMFGGKMSEVTRVFEHITRVSSQALSSQGRHEGGEDGLPESPASPDGPRSAGWFTMDHDPRAGRKFIALYNDGSGAAMFWRHPDGVIDQNGDEGGWPLQGYDRWAYLPDDLEFWCEICPEDPMTLHLPSPDNTNPKAGAPEHG